MNAATSGRLDKLKHVARVSLVTFDPVGARLAGSVIRVLELARALADAGHKPTVLTPRLESDADMYPFPVRTLDPIMAADADVVVLPFHALVRIPALARLRTPLVFDLYDPFIFELLASGTRRREVRAHCSVLNHVLRRGDFFLCGSERQRDMWLGALVSCGRVLPSVEVDECFRRLIDVVPFGIQDDLARDPGWAPAIKGVLPCISPGDTVIVSGGALWEWQDPVTAVRAIARVAQRRSDVHLVLFAGGSSLAAGAARAAAAELGVLDRQVHFLSEWIPYAERGRYLSECDAGITTHRSSLESHFSVRTRVLDYLWAGLPVVCTEGDVLADFVTRHELGMVVGEGDEHGLATAFERIAEDPAFVEACRQRIAGIRPTLTWRTAAQPLIRYCEGPFTGDRAPRGAEAVRDLASAAWHVLRTQGIREAARRVHRHAFVRV